jgi:hypothetical protein
MPEDILINFDLVSLFTKMPTGDELKLLSQQYSENNVRLFHHVPTSSYFCFNDQFYRQTDEVTMGLPLSPVSHFLHGGL